LPFWIEYVAELSMTSIATIKIKAHKPNPTSASPGKCHNPASAGLVCAKCSKKNGGEGVQDSNGK
jgi:hypothetical protein